jgi:hypothetical protein
MSTSIVPIIVPVHSEPSRCPSCKNTESKKEVCAHCGYTYPEEKITAKDILFLMAIVCTATWAIITLIFWMSDFSSEQLSLFEIMAAQWEWLGQLRVW